MPDDKRVDALLSKRIAALRTFIRPEHLDIPERIHVEASLQLAEGELSKVNLFKAPRDKLVCVLNTCRIINNLLNVSSGNRPAGADDFLPVLIYVVLRANPPDLESNLRYISRFRRESRLVSEAAYFYTNLVSATHFLTKCDHAAFTGLDEDVFEAHMAAEGIDVRAEAAHDAAADADAATDDPPAVGAGLEPTRTRSQAMARRTRPRDHVHPHRQDRPRGVLMRRKTPGGRSRDSRMNSRTLDAVSQRRRRRRNASRFVGERWRTSRRRAPRALPPRTPRAHFIFRTSSCTRDRMIYRLVTSRRCWADTRVWRFNTKPCQGASRWCWRPWGTRLRRRWSPRRVQPRRLHLRR